MHSLCSVMWFLLLTRLFYAVGSEITRLQLGGGTGTVRGWCSKIKYKVWISDNLFLKTSSCQGVKNQEISQWFDASGGGGLGSWNHGIMMAWYHGVIYVMYTIVLNYEEIMVSFNLYFIWIWLDRMDYKIIVVKSFFANNILGLLFCHKNTCVN